MKRILGLFAAMLISGTGCVVETAHDCDSDHYGSVVVDWYTFTDSFNQVFSTCETAEVDTIEVLIDGVSAGSVSCNAPYYEMIIDGVSSGNHTITVDGINSAYNQVFYEYSVGASVADCLDTVVDADLLAVQGPFYFEIYDQLSPLGTSGYYFWYSFTDATGLVYLVDQDHDPFAAPFYDDAAGGPDAVLLFPHFPFGDSTLDWMYEVYYDGAGFQAVATTCSPLTLHHVAANDGATVLLDTPYPGCGL